MDSEKALQALRDAGIRLTPEAHGFIKGDERAAANVERLLLLGKPILGKEDIEELLRDVEKVPVPVPVEVKRASGFKPLAKEYSPDIRISEHKDISGKSRCTGTLEDFVGYFRNRFERTRRLLKERITDLPVVNSADLKAREGQDCRIIAMVTEKRMTKKGNMLVTAEDELGSVKVVVPSDKPCYQLAERLLLDEVVAFDVRVLGALLIAKEITHPDIPVAHEQKLCEKDVAIVYMSDLHLGSRYFMDKHFNRFLNWLNGNEGDRELAGKVKYIEIAGDIVDGIGIYPNQEKELVVKDIFKQYEMFDTMMESIPDYIEVIVSPGNHDAVRRAEPQPFIPMELIKSDVRKVGSPSFLEIEGLKHLVYHGTSLDSIIASISGLDYARPEQPMLELLKRRHLSPVYGDNLIVPEARDYLVIDEVPDIMHMGHVHKNGHMQYRGTVIINSGTFQERTDFQVRMGHVPSPALVPVYEVKLGRIRTVDFNAPAAAPVGVPVAGVPGQVS